MSWHPLLVLPGRLLAPLLLALFAMGAAALNYTLQVESIREAVAISEEQRLVERLGIEQMRLDVHVGLANGLMVRRVVTALGLRPGTTHAYLLGADGRIVASLKRADATRSLSEALEDAPAPMRAGLLFAEVHQIQAIHVHRPDGDFALVAHVPVQDGHELIVRVDLAQPLAIWLERARSEVWREAALVLGLAVLLGVVLHVAWFRRASRLTAAVSAIGAGRLDARAGLSGHDELARIGAAVDHMAGELQVRQAELERLSQHIDRSSVVAIEWRNEPGWPVVFVTEGVTQWGYSREALLSGSPAFADLIHPDDRERITAEVASHLAEGPDDYRQEYRLRTADGRWIWVDDRTWLTRDEAGDVTRISGVLFDISPQKVAREAERELLNRLETLANASPALFWTTGVDRRGDWCNDAWLYFTGRTLEQVLGWGWTQDVHPDDLERCLKVTGAAFDARESFSMEFRMRRFDGEYCWFLCQGMPRRDADGRFAGFVGSCLDISVEKAVEHALRESEERLRLALQAANQGIYDLNIQTGEAIVSPEYARMLGYEPEELKETNAAWLARMHPDDLWPVEQVFQRYIAGKLPEYRIEFRQKLKGGGWKWILSMGSLIERSPDGQPLRIIGTHTDIDGRKRMEVALRELNTELEQRVAERTVELQAVNKELEAFSYSVSHDLKAPLRGIDGYSQILAEDYGERLDEEGRELLSRIRRGVRQMHALIEDMLAYSRMERRELENRRVDLPVLVRAVVGKRAEEIARRGARVAEHVPPIELNADSDGLTLVLRNLLENALKFQRPDAVPLVEVGAREEDGCVVMWVRDNGIGFDMKYHDRIFEIFQRLHRAEDYPGTGVGLALVRKAMQRMGGRVWAESVLGAGTTLYLELPR